MENNGLTSDPAMDPRPSLLIVDDDESLRSALSRAMEKRGFDVRAADSARSALAAIEENPPRFAVVDLRLEDGDGVAVVDQLRTANPDARAIILTGYGNIPTAVAAVKAGAIDYIAKPADADDIDKALRAPPGGNPEPPEQAMSADEKRWRHILAIYESNDRNISETARQLSMHRRTLQRMLSRRSDEIGEAAAQAS